MLLAPARVRRRIPLSAHAVDDRLREVAEPARVIEVEVGQDDVPHVIGGEAQTLHLLERGLLHREVARDHVAQWAEARGIAHVVDAEARVTKLVAKGLSEEEVLAKNPLADYHDTWNWGFITTERMTKTLYRSATE